MKIVKIFGIVVAVHAVAFVLIFINPGCRSANTPKPVASAPSTGTAEPITPMPVTDAPLPSSDLNPAVASTPTPTSPASGRYLPTRPVEVPPPAPVEEVQTITYEVKKGDSLWKVAEKNGVTVAELAQANNMTTKAQLKIGQKLTIPVKKNAAAMTSADAKPAVEGAVAYTVKPGDSLSKIAKAHGTTVKALKNLNNLTSENIKAGQKLMLPPGSSVEPVETSAAPSAPAPKSTVEKGALTHVVAPGETLGAIARKYKVSVKDLSVLNNITDPTKVRAGQELAIPANGKKPVEVPAKETTPEVSPTTPSEPTEPEPAEEPVEAPVIKIDEGV